ncbi:unnamed protein product [Adineta ricciae]|uniref:G-protein coupled receptors family 1 profile domain-containing protein n=1 Tax=Adineta ricciae TaxID=249248 RepID=A0A814F787_ADIRI|nr:unnamed protein product [Adineta ricciae]CAF1571056.1 unnamed protein product [Adineta ricciae]
MATVDQFLITSKNVRLRQYSNIKQMRLIACAMIILWCLHGIPFVLYYDIPSISQECRITSSAFRHYTVVYTLVLASAIPVLIVSIFGYLTFRNIRQSTVLVEQRADRQITKMTLLQVLLIIVSVTLTGVFSAYMSITDNITKDAQRLDNELLATTIITLTSYLYFVGNFYMFLITSSRFRSAVRHRMNCCCNEKQVHPSTMIHNEN